MLTIRRNKKIVVSLALVSTMLFSSAPGFAKPITMTPQQEYEAAKTSIRGLGWPLREVQTLDGVFNDLIKFNADKLRRYTDGKQRGIPNIYVTYKNVNNSYTVMGGSIIISNDFLNTLLYNRAKGYPEKINDVPSYRQSAVAAVVAHECSHWYRNDNLNDLNLVLANNESKQREAQKYINEGKYVSLFQLKNSMIKNASQSTLTAYRQSSILKEDQADLDGMEFLNNHPVLSIGGMALFLNCAKDDGLNKNGKDVNEHRTLNERYNVAIDYIRKISYGRVEIKNDLLYLDGQKFMGTGRLPARRDVTAYDRTIYVAGQLASAINHNLSAKSGSIAFKGEYIENLYKTKKMTYFVVEPVGAQKPFFVMDFVPIEINRLNAVLEKRVQPQNDEERVVVEIMNFLNKK